MNEHFQKIYKSVQELDFSDESIVELISLANEAKKIAKEKNPSRTKNPCLNNIVQTIEKQIKPLIKPNISQDERKLLFEDAKSNFKTDLHMWCI